MGRIIALDYGKKRVGIAVTDALQLSTRILSHQPETKIKEWVLEYIEQEEVEKIIIGYPEHKSGQFTKLVKEIDKFIESVIKNAGNIDFIKLEESFSSKDAMQLMIKRGVKKQKRKQKGLLDSYSALVLLHDYLQRN